MREFARRLARFASGLARDPSVPRWAKGLLLFAALPLPGPFDEAVGVVVGAFLLARHRHTVVRHWRRSRAAEPDGARPGEPG